MVLDLFFICMLFFAFVGVVHSVISVVIWLTAGTKLTGSKLVVNICATDTNVEAKLTRANSLVMLTPHLQDVKLEVYCNCNPSSENYHICAFYCMDNSISFFHDWQAG